MREKQNIMPYLLSGGLFCRQKFRDALARADFDLVVDINYNEVMNEKVLLPKNEWMHILLCFVSYDDAMNQPLGNSKMKWMRIFSFLTKFHWFDSKYI